MLPPGEPHSGTLLPAIEDLLNTTGISRKSIQALAVGTGPGSFTGLRVGLATAKGLASVLGVPTIPVPSLDALVFPLLKKGSAVLAVADARKGEVYAACYSGLDPSGLPDIKAGPLLITPDDFQVWLDDLECSEGTEATGTGLDLVAGTLEKNGIFAATDEADSYPRAWSVLELGSRMLQSGISVDAGSLTPFYVRAPDAVLPE